MSSCRQISNLIGIHGAPRSGTTWLGQIFNSSPSVAYRYQPLFSYAFQGRLTETSSVEEVRRFFADLYATDDDFVLQGPASRASGRVSREAMDFEKAEPTHLVYKEVRYHDLLEMLLRADERLKCVGIVRDPVGALSSWCRSPEFLDHWRIEDEWRCAPAKNAIRPEPFFGYDGWKRAAEILTAARRAFPDRVSLIRYEDLTADPVGRTRELFAFCDLEVVPQVEKFLWRSTTTDDGDAYGVFRKLAERRSEEVLPAEAVRWIREDAAASGLSAFLKN